MTVTSIQWFSPAQGHDLHLLPGQVSPRLDHLLWIRTTEPAPNHVTRADSPPAGVTVGFNAAFAGTPDAHGVTLNAGTREVTVADPPPAPPLLRNFIVTATVTEGASIFTERIRVHVHDGMKSFWLSPQRLTVRQGARNTRLSVLAEFNDGSFGDITNWSPATSPQAADRTYVRHPPNFGPELQWATSNAATMNIDAETGVLDALSAAANVTISVTRRSAPMMIGTATATATVVGDVSWATPRTMQFVRGPGLGAVAHSKNVLFLSEGFLAAEQPQYERLVRALARMLATRTRTRPYDTLRDSFNFFSLFVPSPESGISVMNELRVTTRAPGGNEAEALEQATPPGPPAALTLAELMHVVGLPTPVDDPVGRTEANRRTDWNTLYGTRANNAPAATVRAWQAGADRILLNERDTAFHVAQSERPRVRGQAAPRVLTNNPHRNLLGESPAGSSDFEDFLRNLQDTAGAAIGVRWAQGGRDEDLIVLLCRTNRWAGANAHRGTGRRMAIGLGNETITHFAPAAAGLGNDLVPDPIPPSPISHTWMTVAHELAHSFNLGDEYGEFPRAPTPAETTVVPARHNIQTRVNLDDGAGNLDPTRTKWRWPRIEKANLTTAAPVDRGGGRYEIAVDPRPGRIFAVGDIVRLRTRDLIGSTLSTRLRVTAVTAAQVDATVVTPGASVVVATFRAPSVLLAPVRAPAAAPALGDDLELIHPTVLARMVATRNPLNANPLPHEVGGGLPSDPANRACVPAVVPTPTPATNFAPRTRPNPPRYSSWTVGLYEEGHRFDCGIYRPTGVCIMRQQEFTAAGRKQSYQFCSVCRYAIVDAVDPTRHGAIDRDYARRYPQ